LHFFIFQIYFYTSHLNEWAKIYFSFLRIIRNWLSLVIQIVTTFTRKELNYLSITTYVQHNEGEQAKLAHCTLKRCCLDVFTTTGADTVSILTIWKFRLFPILLIIFPILLIIFPIFPQFSLLFSRFYINKTIDLVKSQFPNDYNVVVF